MMGRLAVFREGFEERLVLAAQCLIKQRKDAQLQTRTNMTIGEGCHCMIPVTVVAAHRDLCKLSFSQPACEAALSRAATFFQGTFWN
jgi:hypothetical protein